MGLSWRILGRRKLYFCYVFYLRHIAFGAWKSYLFVMCTKTVMTARRASGYGRTTRQYGFCRGYLSVSGKPAECKPPAALGQSREAA